MIFLYWKYDFTKRRVLSNVLAYVIVWTGVLNVQYVYVVVYLDRCTYAQSVR